MSGNPGGFTPEMMRDVLALRPMPAAWSPGEVDPEPVPTFDGKTVDECISAFREANAAKEKNLWLLAATAFWLERGVGGRPKRQDDESHAQKAETKIQAFCRKAGTSRNTFQRLTRTYGVFVGTRTEIGTSFRHVLSFGHHEIAARLTNSHEEAVNAVAFAYVRQWSANTLETMLVLLCEKSKPDAMDQWLNSLNPGLKMTKHLDGFFRDLERTIDAWPVAMRRQVPNRLWQLCQHVERGLAIDLEPPVVRRSTASDDSEIGKHEVEAVA